MDPRARLSAGQVAASEGRYEEALREYVWFHDHALEHRPSLYGVRLSFALGYWMDLAREYPEARRKLLEIRDRKAETLASGGGDRDLFHDVESINQALGEEKHTYRLFLTMLKTSPRLTPACVDLALEAIVKTGDFRLAERYSQLPEDALICYSDRLNEDVADVSRYGERKTHVLDAYVHLYCDRVSTTIAILRGLGKADEAAICREWAEVLVESAAVRKRVQKKLEERYDA